MERLPDVTGRTYPPGVPSWVDTGQPDMDAAIRFYGGLFGWEFEEALVPGAHGRYAVATLNGQEVGAVGGPRNGPAAWNTHVAVDDADAAVRHLVSLGAALQSAPAESGAGGVRAVLTDPEGAGFRLWQAGARPGAQAVNVPGGWNFSDLHTADITAATGFYVAAFGWQFDELGFGTMIRRPGYGDHLEATVDPDIRARQAGDFTPVGFEDAVAWVKPADPGEPAQWHVSFTVADRDQTADLARRLGAAVLQRYDTDWTRSARIRDPWGAEFTASQFTPPSG
ncbi:VOC family protein [Arthrobacter sp. 24S4-2]|uniref:VOC family protein n=1 Tax=Arthrobacter sp. 24S4-2 TaxID=2575374 RepID=UPI0020C7CB45|nr:VOC family protein [Arthrobacter sp. 24S4-2]